MVVLSGSGSTCTVGGVGVSGVAMMVAGARATGAGVVEMGNGGDG